MGGARASHGVRLHIPGVGDTAAQLRRETEDVISTGRVKSAAVYGEAKLYASAMTLGGLGHHAPVSVERRGNCGRREQMAAEAAAKAMARIRLPMPIMVSSYFRR
jgi:hypothetical protein